VEKTFRDALKEDRSRIQLARISRFGMLELSRQKKQSTIQEISYSLCPYCRGSGVRPSVEYLALSALRRIKGEAAKEQSSEIAVALPPEVTAYLLNQKRSQLSKLEALHGVSVAVSGDSDLLWGEFHVKKVKREVGATEAGGESAEEETKPTVSRSSRRRRRPRQAKPVNSDHSGAPRNNTKPAEIDAANKSGVTESRTVPPEKVQDSARKKNIINKVYEFFK
jgi:ribonuclease E